MSDSLILEESKRVKVEKQGSNVEDSGKVVSTETVIEGEAAKVSARDEGPKREGKDKPTTEEGDEPSEEKKEGEDDPRKRAVDDIERAIFTFPERLMELLDQEVAKDAMWWLEDGDGFCVIPKVFADKVLNKYFQGTKFESFTRKLNRW